MSNKYAVTAYVAVGANLGDARATVARAISEMNSVPLTRVAARSSLYRSAPIDAAGPDFINAVVALDTKLEPAALLAELQQLERAAGRVRSYRNAPRALDLDLLCHGQATLNMQALTLPHPRMAERAFVLLPLHEIAPQLVTPDQLARVAGQPIERL